MKNPWPTPARCRLTAMPNKCTGFGGDIGSNNEIEQIQYGGTFQNVDPYARIHRSLILAPRIDARGATESAPDELRYSGHATDAS